VICGGDAMRLTSASRGVRARGRQSRSADGIAPREAKRKYIIVRSVAREQGGQFSQCQCARRREADIVKGCVGVSGTSRMFTCLARSAITVA
jgi:hypothetical protein